MKIRLKPQYAHALEQSNTIHLFRGCALRIFHPVNPKHDVEVRMQTEEGFAMMEEYERTRNQFHVGITTLCLGDHFEVGEKIVSHVTLFNTKADAIKALTTEGIEMGYMPLHLPLQYLVMTLMPQKSPLEIVPA